MALHRAPEPAAEPRFVLLSRADASTVPIGGICGVPRTAGAVAPIPANRPARGWAPRGRRASAARRVNRRAAVSVASRGKRVGAHAADWVVASHLLPTRAQRKSELAGRLFLQLVVGPDGSVISAADLLGFETRWSRVRCACFGGQFPRPTSGLTMVTLCSPFARREVRRSWCARGPPSPAASHSHRHDDSWQGKGGDALAKLRSALEQNPTSRKKYEELAPGAPCARALRGGARGYQAFCSSGSRFGDGARALGLRGRRDDDPALASNATDTQVETDPSSVKWHVRAARSFEALGDERRACAHWRSLAELQPKSDELTFEALRCRARILQSNETRRWPTRVVRPRSASWSPDWSPTSSRGAPRRSPNRVPGPVNSKLRSSCSSGERCPSVFIVSPSGAVFSPFTPTDSRSSANRWHSRDSATART